MENKNRNYHLGMPKGMNGKLFSLRDDKIKKCLYNEFHGLFHDNRENVGFVVPDECTGVKPFAKTKENIEEVRYECYRKLGYVLRDVEKKCGIEGLIDFIYEISLLPSASGFKCE